MSQDLNIAVAQITSLDSVDHNLALIENIFSKIPKSNKLDLVLFPENTLYMRLIEGEEIKPFFLEDPQIKFLEKLAQERNCYIHIGASPLKINNEKFNSSIFITPQGLAQATYQKMHLFDIELNGAAPMRESDQFRHGPKPSILDINGWKIGESICYDLRFSEMFAYYAQKEVDLILIPAAFLVPTGKAHWEVLLRARAIESQSYVIASAQSGVHESTKAKGRGRRETFGHSMVIDPWGKILVDLTHSPQVEIITLDKEQIRSVRTQIPMKRHRRIKVEL